MLATRKFTPGCAIWKHIPFPTKRVVNLPRQPWAGWMLRYILRAPGARATPGSTLPQMPAAVRPHVMPDTPKTVAATATDSRGKEDNADPLLTSSKGSCPRPRGGAAASVPPHNRYNVGDNDVTTAFDIMLGWP